MSEGQRAFELHLDWDDAEQVAILRHREVTLATQADIERWRELVLIEFSRIRTRLGIRFPLLVDMDGFDLRASCVHSFAGVVANDVRGRFVNAHARFGNDEHTRRTVKVATAKTGIRPNIFDTQAEALADIRRQLAEQEA